MSKNLLLKTRSSKASKPTESVHPAAPKHDSKESAAATAPHHSHDKKSLTAKTSSELSAAFPKRNQIAGGNSLGGFGKSLAGFAKFEKFAADSKAATPASSAAGKSVRFSERYKLQGDGGDNSILKIVVFILVVIGLGLGVIYFVQSNLLVQPTQSGSNNSSSTTSTEQTAISEDGLLVFTKLLKDSEATDVADNEDFTEELVSLGTRENTKAKVAKLTYEPFTSFTRVSWDLEGVEASFPRIEVKQDGDDIKVTFFRVSVLHDSMLETIPLTAGNFLDISSVSNANQTTFTLSAQEANSFYARLPFDESKLVIDFKTDAQLTLTPSTSASTSTSSSVTTSASSTSRSSSSSMSSSSASSTTSRTSSASTTSAISGDDQLTNAASQQPQQIINTTSPIDAKMENYSYQDFGNKFEFRWEFAGNTLKSVPNATAQIITNNEKVYIEVVMKNVTQDIFYAFGWDRASFGGLSLTYSNLKGVIFKGRTGTTSTYWVELGGKSNFQLTANEVSTSGRRRLIIAVFDK